MRSLIVSDTHGKHDNFDAVLEREGKIDLLIHAGDVHDERYIEAALNCPKHMVAGNNDYFTFLPKEKEFSLGNYRVYLVHGHQYHVSFGMQRIESIARQKKADIVIYGHTHMPREEKLGELLLLNPGSLSEPRQKGRVATYILAEVDEKGVLTYEFKEI